MGTYGRMYLLWLGVLSAAAALALAPGPDPRAQSPVRDPILVLDVEDVINPASAEHIANGLQEAKKIRAQLVIIRLDTPGGLVESMRSIVKEILASPIPVAVYVAPSGARAASAGTFITMAAHIAAMAPGTNIGAAHPVAMGQQLEGDVRKKAENDMAAFARSVAGRQERNADWAERAVRESVSADEKEAVRLKVVDLVAADIRALVLAVDGREVKTSAGAVKLETRGAEFVRFGIGFRQKVLSLLGNPNIAYLLMLLGFYGLFFELANPGAILPGVVGGISVILGFYALQVLPINYAGLLLILLGLLFFLLEIKVPSYGALTIGGVISMTLGSIMLIDSPAPYLRVSLMVILPAVAATAGFFFLLIGMGIRAQQRQPVTGHEGLVNARGVVRAEVQPGRPGKVFVHGELWDAEGSEAVSPGESVRVVAVQGLRLRVRREEGSK